MVRRFIDILFLYDFCTCIYQLFTSTLILRFLVRWVMLKKIVYLSLLFPVLVFSQASVPDLIQPPKANAPLFAVHAKGVQVFQCSFATGAYIWQLQAPDALLYDDLGHVVGKHYAGPVWEYKEGGLVVGKIINKIDVTPKSAISWLLVEVVSHKGNGLFSNVTFINRVNTTGGLPPLSRCDSNHLGSESRVPYTADYIFYSADKV